MSRFVTCTIANQNPAARGEELEAFRLVEVEPGQFKVEWSKHPKVPALLHTLTSLTRDKFEAELKGKIKQMQAEGLDVLTLLEIRHSTYWMWYSPVQEA